MRTFLLFFLLISNHQLLFAQTASTVRGNMYQFNGSNQCIDIGNLGPSIHNGGRAVTVQAWVKLTQVPSSYAVIVESNNYAGSYISLETGTGASSLKLSYYASGAVVRTLNDVLVVGEWIHCTGVYNASASNPADRLQIYVNGVRQATTYSGSPPNSVFLARNFYIGCQDGQAQYWPGYIDEVRIWDRPLTQLDIRLNMHLTLQGNEPNLRAYYQFNNDDPPGTIGGVVDASNQGSGTTRNMTNSNYQASEVAVAAGSSQALTISNTFPVFFNAPNISIEFNSSPNGQVVVSRLTTESPHGAPFLAPIVDDEYFVIWNYGSNTAPSVRQLTFGNITGITTGTTASQVQLYKRGSRQYGNTWGSSLATARPPLATGASIPVTFEGTPLTTGFSQFVLTFPPILLSNSLLLWQAKRQSKEQVSLLWELAPEDLFSRVEIQRTVGDRTAIETIAQLTPTSSIGSYIDENSYTNNSYYRLKIRQVNGQITYSDWRVVDNKAASIGLALYPNPSRGSIHLHLSGDIAPQKARLTVTNNLGQLVATRSLVLESNKGIAFPNLLTNLPKGSYYVQLNSADGAYQWQKVVVVE